MVDKRYTVHSGEADRGSTMTTTRGKTIHVSDDVHNRLTEKGKFKDSYNDIIKRLLDENDKFKNGTTEGDTSGQEESSE